ncbi:hypothetical protein THAOC_28622, partial [Thalassiosira oceanica]
FVGIFRARAGRRTKSQQKQKAENGTNATMDDFLGCGSSVHRWQIRAAGCCSALHVDTAMVPFGAREEPAAARKRARKSGEPPGGAGRINAESPGSSARPSSAATDAGPLAAPEQLRWLVQRERALERRKTDEVNHRLRRENEEQAREIGRAEETEMMGSGVEDRRTIELDVKRPADHDGATPDARNRTTKEFRFGSIKRYRARGRRKSRSKRRLPVQSEANSTSQVAWRKALCRREIDASAAGSCSVTRSDTITSAAVHLPSSADNRDEDLRGVRPRARQEPLQQQAVAAFETEAALQGVR